MRLDGDDNDDIVIPLLQVMPDYLEVTTGYKAIGEDYSPLAVTVARFLLQLWYNADGVDMEKLQKTIDNLLTALSVSTSSRKSLYYNRSGYYDPTAGEALDNISKSEKKVSL